MATKRKKPTLTPQALFDYATRFAKRHEDKGHGTKYPTFRQAANRFSVTIAAINDACENWSGEGYMSAAVGFRSGAGIGLYNKMSDYEVEAYV